MNKDIVTITCYGKTKEYERQEAIIYFLQCMMCSEGAEQSRYTNIYLKLISGFKEING